MALVTGNIGDQNVVLDNAATEATLRLLLQATIASSKDEKNAIANMIEKAGLDPAKVQKTHVELTNLEQAAAKLGGAYAGLEDATNKLKVGLIASSAFIGSLTEGSGKASNLFGALGKLPGPLGLLGTGFEIAAKFQEEQLKNYQSLSKSGVNFAGSLTNMRISVSETGLTMDEFVNLVKNNGDAFSKMGGSVNDGAESFTRLGKAMFASKTGDNLRALGFTTEEINKGMLNYISNTGGRTKAEMSNTKQLVQLVASTGEYMKQLDYLTEVTGKSREAQEADLKDAAANKAWEAFLQTLSPSEKNKAVAGYLESMARGGKGAAQAFMFLAQGLPPATKAAAEYAGVQGNMYAVTVAQVAAITDSNKTMDDMRRIGARYGAAAVADIKNLGKAGSAIQNFHLGLEGLSVAQATANRAVANGTDTVAGAIAQLNSVQEKQAARERSEADAAATANKAVNELGQKLLRDLLPAFQTMAPIIVKIVTGLSYLMEFLDQSPRLVTAIELLIGALLAGYLSEKAISGYRFFSGGLVKGGQAAATLGKGVPVVAEAVAGGEAIAGAGAGLLAKGSAKLGGKMLSKFIPGIGLIAGGADAIMRFSEGDYLGAGLAATGGLASLIPGVGGIVAAGFDVVNLARDLHKTSDNDKKETDESKKDNIANISTEDPDANKRLIDELKRLNTISENMLHTMQSVSYDIKRSVSAINGLKPGLYPTS